MGEPIILNAMPVTDWWVLGRHGWEQPIGEDLPADRVLFEHGRSVDISDLLLVVEPPADLPVEILEAWLASNAYVRVVSKNISCTCSCAWCDHMVIQRGLDQTLTHVAASGCTCGVEHPCCGIRLNDLPS